MKLRDIMKREPITASELTRVGEAQRLMRTNQIRHMPVVRDGRLLGIVSERDLLAYHAAMGADRDWWRPRVTEVMSTPAQTAGPDDSITEAAGRLAAARIGALPIVELGRLIGLVTITDILDATVQSAMA